MNGRQLRRPFVFLRTAGMFLDTSTQLLAGLALLSAVMLLLWLIQNRTRDAGTVDVGWATGVALLAVLYGLTTDVILWRRIVIPGVAAIWGFRLASHLLFDRIIGKKEDGRYQNLREYFGTWAQPFFFVFFQLQTLLALFFSLPILIALHAPRDEFSVWEVLGIAVWLMSVAGESLADAQLAKFRADPANRGKTCRAGLWRYSRHPNYFFEWLHWWAYVLFAVGADYWWVTWTAPLLMLFFLFRVTGIPATERQALRSRGDDYRRYQRTTSMFVPWFPGRENV